MGFAPETPGVDEDDDMASVTHARTFSANDAKAPFSPSRSFDLFKARTSEAWGPPQFHEKGSRSEKAILRALGDFRGILAATLANLTLILRIHNSILGMASRDFSNTRKTTILEANSRSDSPNWWEPTWKIFIGPCILGAFFSQELGWSPLARRTCDMLGRQWAPSTSQRCRNSPWLSIASASSSLDNSPSRFTSSSAQTCATQTCWVLKDKAVNIHIMLWWGTDWPPDNRLVKWINKGWSTGQKCLCVLLQTQDMCYFFWLTGWLFWGQLLFQEESLAVQRSGALFSPELLLAGLGGMRRCNNHDSNCVCLIFSTLLSLSLCWAKALLWKLNGKKERF